MAKPSDCRISNKGVDVAVENLARSKRINVPLGLVHLPPWRWRAVSHAEKRLAYVELEDTEVDQAPHLAHARQRLGDGRTAVGMGTDNHRSVHLCDNRSNDRGILIQIPEIRRIAAATRQGDRAHLNATELLHQQLPAPRAMPSPVHKNKGQN